jgi:hypothetical protein
LRGGTAGSARGAASFLREQIPTARTCGATGTLIVRGDSAFYSADVIAACREHDTRFSVAAKLDPKVKAAIATIDPGAWTPIKYPKAIWDKQAGGWVSDADVAEVPYTAFTSKKGKQVTTRLIVRRVRRLNEQATRGQDELFPAHRYYPIFTDSPCTLIQAQEQHRDHAVQEQVNADLIDNGPLAHLPSGRFTANAAWLTLAAIAHNLLRATGTLAGTFHDSAEFQDGFGSGQAPAGAGDLQPVAQVTAGSLLRRLHGLLALSPRPRAPTHPPSPLPGPIHPHRVTFQLTGGELHPSQKACHQRFQDG